jgi:hypothetical protein
VRSIASQFWRLTASRFASRMRCFSFPAFTGPDPIDRPPTGAKAVGLSEGSLLVQARTSMLRWSAAALEVPEVRRRRGDIVRAAVPEVRDADGAGPAARRVTCREREDDRDRE